MKNPFVRPIGMDERLKAAQVCPKCLGQVFSMWGTDLRIKGRCPQCGEPLAFFKGVVHRAKPIRWLQAAAAALVVGYIGYRLFS